MNHKPHHVLFNTIAPVYNWFFAFQQRHYQTIISQQQETFDLLSFDSILDVGCGTGALCSVLAKSNVTTTGVDPAIKMIKQAKRNTTNHNLQFVVGDALEGLPFDDQQFDVSVACYVAHGLKPDQRHVLYVEMARVASKYVLLYDYNEQRSLLSDVVEWLEKGDYFNFIHQVKEELKTCMHDGNYCFKHVKVIKVGKKANWYICEVNHDA